MLLSLSDPTVSVPTYLFLLNLLFIFLLCCPHSLHCLTWSSPHSTIKSCCHQGDFSTRAGRRLCLSPHSSPSCPHDCCEKPMHKSVWLLGRLHLWYQHLQEDYWAAIPPSLISCMIFCVGQAVLGWAYMYYILYTVLFSHVFLLSLTMKFTAFQFSFWGPCSQVISLRWNLPVWEVVSVSWILQRITGRLASVLLPRTKSLFRDFTLKTGHEAS